MNMSNLYVVKLPYPPSVNNYWRITGSRMYISEAGKTFKTLVQLKCRAAGMKPLHGDVEVRMTLHPRINKDGTASKTRIDLDNANKALMDSLIGYAYHDDKQVTRIVSELGMAIPDGGLTVVIREDV